jgi:hypothetical protein
MSMVKCKFCRERVHPNQLDIHTKHCVYARRAKKRESSTFTIEMVNPEDITTLGTEIKLVDNNKKKLGRPKGKKNETSN